MSENDKSSNHADEGVGATKSPVDPVVLAATMTALEARGGKTRSMTVMQYPPQLLRDLCEKLADRRQQPAKVLEWLTLECMDRDGDGGGLAVPSQTAFYDFAKLVREQYRLSTMLDRRKVAENYVAAASDGSGDAQQLALNMRLTELLTDMLMQADGSEIDTDRLFALISGVKAVAAVAFDKQKMDSRIKALEKLNQERDAAIKLKDQRLLEMKSKFEAAMKTLQTKSAGGKGKITVEDIADAGRLIFG